MMFSRAKITAVIPVTDIDRARIFYEDLLGLPIHEEIPEQNTMIYSAGGTYLLIYQRATASAGDHTIAGFELGDAFDDVVDYLLDNGIVLDTFEIPGVEMPWDDRGVLWEGDRASAWLKDPDGNVIAITRNAL
jgi:catechol 2,3-dioxygenase-like lactoylglutathione lyase family enzyme